MVSGDYMKNKPQTVQLKRSEDKLHVGTISSLTVTRYHMPKYNAFVCRGGVHGDVKYNRSKEKKNFSSILKEYNT